MSRNVDLIFQNEHLTMVPTTYHDGNLAIQIYAENGPYARLSVNLPDRRLPDHAFWLKDWSDNAPIAEYLKTYGYIEPVWPIRRAIAGFEWVDAYQIPPIRITKEIALDHYRDHIRVQPEFHIEEDQCDYCDYLLNIEDL